MSDIEGWRYPWTHSGFCVTCTQYGLDPNAVASVSRCDGGRVWQTDVKPRAAALVTTPGAAGNILTGLKLVRSGSRGHSACTSRSLSIPRVHCIRRERRRRGQSVSSLRRRREEKKTVEVFRQCPACTPQGIGATGALPPSPL